MVGVDLCVGAWQCVWGIYRELQWLLTSCLVWCLLSAKVIAPARQKYVHVCPKLTVSNRPVTCHFCQVKPGLDPWYTITHFEVLDCNSGVHWLSVFETQIQSKKSLSCWLALKASVTGWRALGLYRKSIFYDLEILLTFSKKRSFWRFMQFTCCQAIIAPQLDALRAAKPRTGPHWWYGI